MKSGQKQSIYRYSHTLLFLFYFALSVIADIWSIRSISQFIILHLKGRLYKRLRERVPSSLYSPIKDVCNNGNDFDLDLRWKCRRKDILDNIDCFLSWLEHGERKIHPIVQWPCKWRELTKISGKESHQWDFEKKKKERSREGK